MSETEETWAQKHTGPIAAALIGSFIIGAGAWAINTDRTLVRIETLLVEIERDKELTRELDKRVGLIEATRYRKSDAEDLEKRVQAQDDIINILARDVAELEEEMRKR